MIQYLKLSIEKNIKSSLVNSKTKKKTQINSKLAATESLDYKQSLKLSFVREGCSREMPKAKKNKLVDWWGTATDWIILIDTCEKQYQIPPQIGASGSRPDLCIYSLETKKCLYVELTSPFEDNISTWKIKKRGRYQTLVQDTERNGWKVKLYTVEVGARGFVNMDSMKLFKLVGLTYKQCNNIRRELSEVAIRCSHFIWLNRNNQQWQKPARVVL